jgi:hypothetical protein
MNKKLAAILNHYINEVPEVKDYCQRCLNTARWDGNVLVMVIDAAFMSIGLNYFQSVVPNVDIFRNTYVHTNKILCFEDMYHTEDAELQKIWKNRRSWSMAKEIARYFATSKRNKTQTDKEIFIHWAHNTNLGKWKEDPIGRINGVGINTFQYLRMMGGVDTVMPDKIVKRVINDILLRAGENIPESDMEFIKAVEAIGIQYGYRPIELCWMTWLIQSESNLGRMQKYSHILSKI